MIGTSLAHYKITAELGKGGMGEVFRATDTKLGREVALKVLPPVFSSDPERMARFEREARTLASFQHPNIASIYGFEEAEGQRFLIMELAEGEDLSERLARGPVTVENALKIALQIAEGLEAAHESGIVHRVGSKIQPLMWNTQHDGISAVNWITLEEFNKIFAFG